MADPWDEYAAASSAPAATPESQEGPWADYAAAGAPSQPQASPISIEGGKIAQQSFDAMTAKIDQAFQQQSLSAVFKARAAQEFKAGGLLNDLAAIGNGFGAMVAGVPESIWDFMKLPGDVYTGKQPVDESVIPRTAFAAMMTGGDISPAHPAGVPREATAAAVPEGAPATGAREAVTSAQEARQTLAEARDLGVIGPKEPPAPPNQTPAEMTFSAYPVGSAVTPEEMKGRFGHAPGKYDVKGAEWAAKLDGPEGAREAVADLGRQYDWFPDSRSGAPSPKARAAIAEAAGLDPGDMDAKWLSEEFNSDAKVRAVIQALRQTTQDFVNAKDEMKANPTEENAAAMMEAQERHRYVLEYTMGARAESGRSLNAWKEALRETERSRATVKLKADEEAGNVPSGLTDLVSAAGDIQRNLKNPKGPVGVDNLIKAAQDLVDAQDKAPETRSRLGNVAKQARAAAKEIEGGARPTGLDALIGEAQELAKTLPQGPQEIGRPEPQGLASMIGEAQRAARETGAPGAAAKLISLAEQAERLAMTMPRTPEEAAAKLPPDLAELVGQARSTLTNLRKGGGTDTPLDQIVGQVEKQTQDILKQKPPRKPVEALPPELQALVDKAERVVDRFGGTAKGEQAAFLLARAGRTAAEQADLARQIEGLTPNQVARVLQRVRDNPAPGWVFWSIQQGLISGLITHTKYALVNLGQTFVDRLVVPEIAAIYGKIRGDDVSLLAPFHGGVEIFHGVPDAIAGFRQAFRTGTRVPLESELRLAERGEVNPEAAGALLPYGQPGGPNWGALRKVFSDEGLDKAAQIIGIPGRSAGAIHTFFKILNERAAAGARAFEMAQKEGPKLGTDEFWQRYQYHLDNPTDEALRRTVEDAYRGTFMEKLGKQSDAFARLVRNSPAKWLIFFTHIPLNMMRRSVEMSPLAALNTLGETRMGSAIKGELGHEAQNLSFAYMTVGTAVGAYFIAKALDGKATGDFPTDPDERKRWETLGIPANSIKTDSGWMSLERLGPGAMVSRIAANWASVIAHYDGKDEGALMKASLSVSLGTAAALADDVGFETIKNIVNVLENPAEAARTAAWQMASMADPISLKAQGASFLDPYMRRADTFIDALKYRTPVLREGLLPKRDPVFGEPLPNPGYHAVLRGSAAPPDPVKDELDRLRIYPGYPESRIGGVKLTPELYDRYQATAGPLAKMTLDAMLRTPGWFTQPDYVREMAIRHAITGARETAAAAMQARYPELITAGIQQRVDHITGAAHTSRPKETPAALEGVRP